MIAVVFAALTIPVAGVVISAQRAIKGSAQPAVLPAPAEAQPVAGLQQSLGGLAEQVLLPVETMVTVSVTTSDINQEVARIQKLGEALGGEIIITREQEGESILMAKFPSDQAKVFLSAFKKSDVGLATEGPVFLQIEIRHP